MRICEVGPRDGLQNEPVVLSPATRAELCGRLVACGIAEMEAVSFVRDDRVPAMAGAEEVVRALPRTSAVRYDGLVLNERGFERLSRSGLDAVRLAVSCTETFSVRNSGMPAADAVAQAGLIAEAARDARMPVTAVLMVAFGCPFEGAVSDASVLQRAAQMQTAGIDEIVLADTIGVATPGQVRRLVKAVAALGVRVGLHLHDTRNTANANAFVGLEAGAEVLDAAVGGLGGCPFAPGASGNLATEDLVYMLEREGIETGIDLDELVSVARWLEEQLGKTLSGRVYRAAMSTA